MLGAGMMGAAIAYVVAQSGTDVVLRDVTVEAAERGKDYACRLLDQAVARGRTTEAKRDEVLGRILATDNRADAKGCDFVIEAVFEDPELKKKVFAEIEQYVGPRRAARLQHQCAADPGHGRSCVAPGRPDRAALLKPRRQMPLLEIVVSENAGDEAIARAIDFALQIRKTPIVVSDSYAFYANRIIARFTDEALNLVAEGVHPASVEQAATQAGFPVGALALYDEINMATIQQIQHGFVADAAARGITLEPPASYALVDRMVADGRPGRLHGKGFYEYAEDGTRLGLWPTR